VKIMANRNFDLEIQRLELKKLNISLSRSTMQLRLAELEDEKNRLSENLPLYDKQLSDTDQEIQNIQKLKYEI